MADANDKFEQIVREYWNFRLASDPVTATALGVHLYDGLLSDRAPGKIKQRINAEKRFLKKLKDLKYKKLTEDNRIDREILLGYLFARLKIEEKHPSHKISPTSYVEEITNGIYPLVTREFGAPEVRAQNLTRRLAATPAYLARAKKNLEKPPRAFTETAILQGHGTLEFMHDVVPSFAKTVPPKVRVKLNVALREATDAFEDFTTFLGDKLLPRSKGRLGLGKGLFDLLLKKVHHVHLSVDELEELGEAELAAAKRKLAKTARALEKGKNWETLTAKYQKRVPRPDRLLDVYKREMDRARKFIVNNKLFTLPPGESLSVVATPDFARPTVPYATYLPPAPYESGQAGQFWVTRVEAEGTPAEIKQRMAFHATMQIPCVVVHETYPGRHLQTVRANRVARPVRILAADSVFVEGWALYCEQLMLEEGFFKDNASRLFLHRSELFRACRVLIDVGLHTGKMNFDEAVELLVEEAGLQKEDAEAEVRRYCSSPTEPLSYLVGRKMILDLRRDYKAKHRRDFSLKEFHERVLNCGPIPVGAIRKLLWA